MRKSIDSAVLLATCTAVLYSWSTANYHGFLITVNLDPDMMERSFHQVIYSGFLVSFGSILSILFLIALSLLLWSHGILPDYIKYVRSSIKSKRRIIKFRHYWMGNKIISALEKQERNRFNYFLLYSFIGLAFILSLVYFEGKGQQHAKNIIERHLSGENDPTAIISVVIDDHKKILRYLGCGAKNCAGIEEETNRIYYFSQSSGYSVIYEVRDITGVSNG